MLGESVRSKQTTLIVTIAMVSSLLLMSQMPAVSEVKNIFPGDTEGEGPPVTDTDGDGIPDVHENLFSDWLNSTAVDGREINIEGLDRNISSDAESDRDRDGMNASEEYCWPYSYAACFSTLRIGLTGELNLLTGQREYLDPRRADSDGDGMPDGFEISMCQKQSGSFDSSTGQFSCQGFDPLNSSDGDLDLDGDGFDIDRDGIIALHEDLTSAEEYNFGADQNWTTELDGLRCTFSPPDLPNQTHWPSIGFRWPNMGDACAANYSVEFGEDMWLGTDPTNSDSDWYYLDSGIESKYTYPVTGDGIPDGWEIYFQLNPHNRSDRLLDSDDDGWDIDRNGEKSADMSVSPIDLMIGEELSNIQEYFTYLDGGNNVRAGLKQVGVESISGTLYEYPHSSSPQGDDTVSIMHHDVISLVTDEDGEQLYAGTRLGISIIELDMLSSSDHNLPSGYVLSDMILLDIPSGEVMLISTNKGIILADLDIEGQLTPSTTWAFVHSSPITALEELALDSATTQILAAGPDGVAYVIEIASSGGLVLPVQNASSDFSTPLSQFNATPQDMAHVRFESQVPQMYIGTDKGLLICPTITVREAFTCAWRFNEWNTTELRNKPSGDSFEYDVRSLYPDGPGEQTHIIWIATGSGVHKLDLSTDTIEHSYHLEYSDSENNTEDSANDVYSIMPSSTEVFVGSAAGMWSIYGSYATAYGTSTQERIPGHIQSMVEVDIDDVNYVIAGLDPGQFSNIELIDPGNNDSDFDGILDGWEHSYGLDPTDPYDAHLDVDGDGLNRDVDQDPYLERLWTNLDEFRYLATTPEGWNSTDPRNIDTDGDGIPDGAEVFGFYFGQSNLWCHYYPNMSYDCQQNVVSAAANSTYLDSGGNDQPLDPTNPDSDGDGMPDGWEIEHRRWIGLSFNGGNNWTLDPLRAEDAMWDADGDGLLNLYEYEWGLTLELARAGELAESHRELPSYAMDWVATDPNNPDSDGDTLPDGWEARYLRDWQVVNSGINPLNGSDWMKNPDGDGYDINHDGVLAVEEQLFNWLEYHLGDGLYSPNATMGTALPGNLTTSLFNNVDSWGLPESTFGQDSVSSTWATVEGRTLDAGSANPVNSDSDNDGMPDGWEIWFARWDILADGWTLNPLNDSDLGGDADEDGMTNWEEYNAIDPMYSESNSNQSSPQWFVTLVGQAKLLNSWTRITTDQSFGSFITQEQINISGRTADPNNPDSDGDGILDGIEMLFTTWNESAEVWTLNPLVAGDGQFDSDNDAIIDALELSIAYEIPDNGGSNPFDAPLLGADAEWNQPQYTPVRVHNMLITKEGRQVLVYGDFQKWQGGEPPTAILQVLLVITDPNHPDTDRDEMSDGFEYWFTAWDLDESRWSMNPLIDNDVYLDSDDDSYDCDQNGNISAAERYTNLNEWKARQHGKENMSWTIPSGMGIIGYGEDSIAAMSDEYGYSYLEAKSELWQIYASKDAESMARMNKINQYDSNNFNRSLFGVSDPTSSDSDGDGIPDGWEWCYSSFNMPDLTTQNHWSSNPLNPLDIDYDGDQDGWYDRTSFDTPAPQGSWQSRTFTQDGLQIISGPGDLPFTNIMEYWNNTRPDMNDSDGDSISMRREGVGQMTTLYELDWNLSDGREVFKYGINPKDNDSDGDMLPDWYEYARGWNEGNDNYSTWMKIQVWWDDTGSCPTALYYNDSTGDIERARLNYTWFNLDPANPLDANQDPDRDGWWDCTGIPSYQPYTNFQEFYAIHDQSLASPSAVRLAGISYAGEIVSEWWQLRAYTLKLDGVDEYATNYLRMYKRTAGDTMWALLIEDADTDFESIDPSNDVDLCRGDITDQWDIYYAASPNSPPSLNVGEWEYGWWHLDIDGDHTAEGTDPTKWDTDGDWLHDGWEVTEDEVDGVRGDSSPIHYDSRATTT